MRVGSGRAMSDTKRPPSGERSGDRYAETPTSARYSDSASGPRYADATSSPRRGSRNALCLWLPTFELRLELVRSPELDSTSVALLSPEGGVRRALWQVSE